MKFLVSVTDWEGKSYEEATDWCARAFRDWMDLSLAERRKLLEWGSALCDDNCMDQDGFLLAGKYPPSGDLLLDVHAQYHVPYETLGWILGCGKDTVRRRVNEARVFRARTSRTGA